MVRGLSYMAVALVPAVLVLGGCAGDLFAPERQAAATMTAAEATGAVAQKWSTDKSAGQVTATGEAFKDAGGRVCRDLRQDVTIDAVTRSRDVTACKAADETWVVTERAAKDI